MSREWVYTVRAKKKSTSKSYMIISIISILLIAAIVFAVIYKNNQVKPSNSPVEEPVSEQISTQEPEVSKEENTQPSTSVPKKELKDAKANYVEAAQPVTEPTYVKGILIVNKQFGLPSTYNKDIDPEASAAVKKMMEAAKVEGHSLQAFSGFRSYEYQTSLYERYVNKDGKEAADRYSARPGYSEHQSGLAFDIGEVGREDLWLTEAFGETEAGKWLMNHAHEYGFILRYPKGKEHVTGFMYESWHYRFVGNEHAAKIFEQNVTLEEYLDVVQY
jgi:zinc D-Ala-D-Ala carboxypeptidase